MWGKAMTKGIHDHPAGDAAARGAFDRLGDLGAAVVGQPDIEHDMDMVAGAVDGIDQPVDRGVILASRLQQMVSPPTPEVVKRCRLEALLVADVEENFAGLLEGCDPHGHAHDAPPLTVHGGAEPVAKLLPVLPERTYQVEESRIDPFPQLPAHFVAT